MPPSKSDIYNPCYVPPQLTSHSTSTFLSSFPTSTHRSSFHHCSEWVTTSAINHFQQDGLRNRNATRSGCHLSTNHRTPISARPAGRSHQATQQKRPRPHRAQIRSRNRPQRSHRLRLQRRLLPRTKSTSMTKRRISLSEKVRSSVPTSASKRKAGAAIRRDSGSWKTIPPARQGGSSPPSTRPCAWASASCDPASKCRRWPRRCRRMFNRQASMSGEWRAGRATRSVRCTLVGGTCRFIAAHEMRATFSRKAWSLRLNCSCVRARPRT